MDKDQKRSFWERKVKEIEESGMTVASWVRNQDEFTVHQVRYWIRKFDKESRDSAKQSSQHEWMSVEVSPPSEPKPKAVLIYLQNGTRVEIPSGMNDTDLSNLLRAVNAL